MANNNGPKLKRVRRLGEDFAMAGDRSSAAKYVKLHRKQPPGMHGKKAGFAKLTSYAQQLREKQKARAFYNLTEKQLRSYYIKAGRQHGSTDTVLLIELERRLDNVLYRAGWANSHPAARQIVSHAHIKVNGRKVDTPSFQVKSGDVVTFFGTSTALKDKIKETAKSNQPTSWLKLGPDELTIQVLNLPTRAEIEAPFNEKVIIEFYSR
jgi:small subunit ribosomal protein S4